LLAFERSAPGQRLLCVFNIGDAPREWRPEQPDQWQVVEQVGEAAGWQFAPFAALVAERRV
jgi:alpha-glucosidase